MGGWVGQSVESSVWGSEVSGRWFPCLFKEGKHGLILTSFYLVLVVHRSDDERETNKKHGERERKTEGPPCDYLDEA